VEDSKHADFDGSNPVEDAVRKPAQNGMPDLAMNDFVLFWIGWFLCALTSHQLQQQTLYRVPCVDIRTISPLAGYPLLLCP